MPILLQLAQSYSNPDSVNYKIAYLREQIGDADFGKLAYEDQVQLAMLGETIIEGGFLKTELIAAKSIRAEHLDVEDLSAITGKFTSLMAGDPFGARLEMGESAGEPFLAAYDSANDLRVKLLQDRLQFFTNDVCGGEIYAQTLERDSADYHYLHVIANDYLSLFSGFQLNINSNHEISIVAAGEGEQYKPAAIMLQSFEGLFSSIEIMADSTHINGDLYLRGSKLLNFAYASDETRRETSMSTYTNDYNLLLEISVKAGEYYMVQFEGMFWILDGTRVNAYVDVIGSATRVSGTAYLATSATGWRNFTGSTMTIWRADADGKLSFIMKWMAEGGGTANCQYRSMKAWRIG